MNEKKTVLYEIHTRSQEIRYDNTSAPCKYTAQAYKTNYKTDLSIVEHASKKSLNLKQKSKCKLYRAHINDNGTDNDKQKIEIWIIYGKVLTLGER